MIGMSPLPGDRRCMATEGNNSKKENAQTVCGNNVNEQTNKQKNVRVARGTCLDCPDIASHAHLAACGFVFETVPAESTVETQATATQSALTAVLRFGLR